MFIWENTNPSRYLQQKDIQIRELRDKIWELKEQKMRRLVVPRHQKLQKAISSWRRECSCKPTLCPAAACRLQKAWFCGQCLCRSPCSSSSGTRMAGNYCSSLQSPTTARNRAVSIFFPHLVSYEYLPFASHRPQLSRESGK